MSDLRQAAELALKALSSCSEDETYEGEWLNYYDEDLVRDAIQALRQALSQHEQEPTIAYSIGAEIASEDWINALKQGLIKGEKK